MPPRSGLSRSDFVRWPVTAMASASQSGSAVWVRPAVAETTGIVFDNAGL
jgi:hypothetical protein